MRTERIYVRPNNENYPAISKACCLAKSLYNAANFIIRQAFINENKLILSTEVDKEFKKASHKCYCNMPSAASAQRTMQILGKDWKSFFAANKAYKNSPSKFTGSPKLPKYAKHQKTFVVGRNGFKIQDGYVYITGADKLGLKPFKIICCQQQAFNEKADKAIVQDIRFVPLGNCYFIDVVYKNEDVAKDVALNKENIMGIDLGIDNLATIVINQPGSCPVLINGKTIKTINNSYNKERARLSSIGKLDLIPARSAKRYNWINDYFHKVSRYIVELCIKTGTGTIVIGHNNGWKQSCNLGKVNNQKFVFIPHNSLIEKIKYKAQEYGINVVVVEESYTSKASSIDLDPIPTYGQVKNPVFSGKRVKRGLYKAKNGALLNADVNGSINIIRKAFGDDPVKGILKCGSIYQPKRITL